MRWPSPPLATWTLIDQAVLSFGTFVLNIVLARHLPISHYGGYAMFVGIVSIMQVVCGTLLFYPLSVRGSLLAEAELRRLIVTGLGLTAILGVPLAVFLAILTELAIAPGLFLPAFSVLLASQLQEAVRRGLLAGFRHREAVLGDAISYLGQGALVILVVRQFDLDLASAFYAMAATSLAAAGVQWIQLALTGAAPFPLVETFRDFWTLGIWSLSSNVLNIVRGHSIPWLLSFVCGQATAGLFLAAVNIANMTNPVQTGISNIIPQAAARASARSESEALRAAWPYMATGFPIIAGLALAMIAAPEMLLTFAYQDTFEIAAIAGPLQVLAIAATFSYVAAAGCAYLHGVNGGREGLIADTASSACLLIAIYPAVHFLGMTGACIAALIATIVRAGFILLAIASRLARERMSRSTSQPRLAEGDTGLL